jgi:GntR family transcriptional repressor for pyruvate dehydrogenase complex
MNPIRRTSLQSDIIESIRSYIAENQLKENDRLPSQEEMTRILNVSRTSLREALKTLEAFQIIKVINGKGIFVGSMTGSVMESRIATEREREMLLDAIEMRRYLDKEMIRLVVKNATGEDFDFVEEKLDLLLHKYELGLDESKEDYEFHTALYKITHNQVMEQVHIYMNKVFKHFWEYPLNMKHPFNATIPLHKELFLALKNRSRAEAEKVSEKSMDMMVKEIKEA